MSFKDIDKKDKRKLIVIAIMIAVISAFFTASIMCCSGCIIGKRFIKEERKTENVTTTHSDYAEKETSDKDSETAGDEIISETREDETTFTDNEEQTEESSEINLTNKQPIGEEKTTTKKPVSNIVSGSTVKKLHVSGTNLMDDKGNIVQLKGISTHGIAWFPGYVNNDCFKQLHDEFGVSVVRLAMYSAEYNGYCTGGNKEEQKKLIKNGVKYATDNGMYVIIDWHVLGDRDPNIHKAEAKKFFEEMAKTYADCDNVIYEICNEPNGGTSWSQVKSYALEVIKVIRTYDSDGIILVGTPNWCQYVTDAAKDPIKEYDNIMYTLHYYAATHTDSLRNEMVKAIGMGLPIFVSEYGICDASGNGAINEPQANAWMNLLDEYGISSVFWNLSNKNESSAAIKSSCNKLSGFSESDLSQGGKWFVNMLDGKLTGSAETVTNNNSENNDTGNNGQQTTETTTTAPYEIKADAFATLTNSWGSGTEYFYQYDISVKNNESKACTTWEAVLEFDKNIKVSSGWCGKFKADGNKLYITPENYNSIIEAGGEIKGIGIIISADGELKIVK